MSIASHGHAFQIAAVVLYFTGMVAIGWFAYLKTKNNLDGYLLADRGLAPWVAALSAGASDMSGWLLMGLPGAIYLSGMDTRSPSPASSRSVCTTSPASCASPAA